MCIRDRYELVRVDFAPQSKLDTYTFYSPGIFQAREHTASYRIENLGADFHFRYTVKQNGVTLYDGFIVHSDTLSLSFVCVDPPGSIGRRGCDEGVGGQIKINQVNNNFDVGYLAAGLLTRDGVVFADMTAYGANGGNEISAGVWASKIKGQQLSLIHI